MVRVFNCVPWIHRLPVELECERGRLGEGTDSEFEKEEAIKGRGSSSGVEGRKEEK